MSSTLKQALSIPLLIAEVLIPFGFSSGLKSLFWVDPLVENKQVYSTANNIWIEFWSSMRDFPESKKRKNKASTDEKPRKWYHIILRLLGSLIAVDLGASWITSFTSKETSSMPVERPGLFLVYYLMAITYTSSVFNCIGYILQLLYCVFLEGGSYSSAAVIGELALEKMLTDRLSPGFRSSYLARTLKYTWTIGFGYLTYYYVMNGFIACEFYLEAPVRIIGPHIIKTVRKMPAVLQYFGSYASQTMII
ncbi:hypothetical protein RO3G_02599 [Rhizopus delemar RA 99-880]|uniref:Uncharacterized protein n=1 Tax=Rhizopus delemar (strain RA 99-880 / ATCC MYA-4621 / FGSC 9543 / NRRL 43880) TaxID=246409 RepID=I1BNW5_RHIO9|nr:hypothetical protein RO3G_02599 [Rhizopus delemar RA 99-880]|eukprot:EIE77895.1 hypothetical protein RO3G_02599 [Rhizopus delemar RA 99-880]